MFSGDVCIVGHASGFITGLVGPSDSNLSTDVVIRLCPGPSEQITRSEQQALRLCSALPDVAAADRPSLNLSMADIGVVSDGCLLLRVGAVVASVGVSVITVVD